MCYYNNTTRIVDMYLVYFSSCFSFTDISIQLIALILNSADITFTLKGQIKLQQQHNHLLYRSCLHHV